MLTMMVPATTWANSGAVGVLDGELSITPSGSAAYTIPIKLPPGVGNVQPDLALTYNSQAGNGMVGLGWSVSGISVINRCPKNLAQDNEIKGVQVDINSDVLCLNGSRLTKIGGVGGYFGGNSVYRTELDGFSRIQKMATSDSFLILTKSGVFMEYGSDQLDGANTSRLMAKRTSDDVTLGTKIWALSKVRDISGNAYYYKYITDHNTGEQYPDEITYSHSSAGGNLFTIKFQWDTNRPDKISGYFLGTPNTINRRLTGIHIIQNGFADPVARYIINYDNTTDKTVGRSTVKSIQECRRDMASVEQCMQPTMFDWQSTDISFGIEALPSNGICADDSADCNDSVGGPNYRSIKYPDINGDSLSDICFRADSGIMCHVNQGDGSWGAQIATGICADSQKVGGDLGYCDTSDDNYPTINYLDMNADGRDDIVYRGDHGIRIWTSTGAGFSHYSSSSICANDSEPAYGHCNDGDNHLYIQYPDINGDAIPDLCYRSDQGIRCHYGHNVGGAAHWSAEPEISIGACQNYSDAYGKCETANDNWGTISYVDINGDALLDLVYRGDAGIQYWKNNGTTLIHTTSWTICANGSYAGPICNDNDNHNYIYYPDINGDGLADLCYRSDALGIYCYYGTSEGSQNQWKFAFSTGICANGSQGFGKCETRDDNFPTIQFVDINGDGMSDLTYRGDYGMRVWLSTGSGFVNKTGSPGDICKNGSGSYGGCYSENSYLTVGFGDFNGDGKPDLTYRSKAGVVVWLQDNFKYTKINRITNGFGASTSFTYKPLTDASVYSRSTACKNASVYPINCVVSPMEVVSMQTADNGIGGTTSITYAYTDAKVHLRGRGSLGFGSMLSTDTTTKLITINKFDNTTMVDLYSNDPTIANNVNADTFVYQGMPTETIVTRIAAFGLYRDITKTTNQYEYKTLNGGKSYFPYVAQSIEENFELNGSLVTKQTTLNRYDDFGNATEIVIKKAKGAERHTTVTNNNYDNLNDEEKRLGRLGRSIVTSTRLSIDVSTVTDIPGIAPVTFLLDKQHPDVVEGHTAQRLTDYVYYPVISNSKTNYLLQATIEEPLDPNLYVKTEYTYDDYGNKQNVMVSGSTAAQYEIATRETSNVYSYGSLLGGEYSVTSTNAETLDEVKTINARYGVANELIGPNKLKTRWEYDAFGRKLKEVRADNTESSWAYNWCNGSVKCPHHAVYYITSNHYLTGQPNKPLSPPTVVYYDQLGRELRTESIGLNNLTVLKDIQYNELGNVWRQSRPYFSHAIPDYWVTNSYDLLGRLVRMVQPDGSVVTTKFNGLETEIIRERRGENGYTAIRNRQTNNLQGKVEWVEDALGKLTRYTYLPFGELETTTDPMGNTMQMKYGNRGRKLSMDDPDMGIWQYAHDALGNLRWQKDAKGQQVSMSYDRLNRITMRTDSYATTEADTTVWSYYGINAGYGERGKLHKITRTTDNYSEFNAYDTLGRPLSVTTMFAGSPAYTVSSVYDSDYPRVDHVVYPAASNNGNTTNFKKKNIYDPYGFLIKVVDQDNPSTVFWEPVFANADGKITLENVNNNTITTARGFNPATGVIQTISTGAGTNSDIQNLEYVFDSLGNLERRTDHNRKLLLGDPAGVTEYFQYDGINRLTSVSENNVTAKHYQYDAIGNITYNSDVGYYTYGDSVTAGPHAVVGIQRTTSGSAAPGDANNDQHIDSIDTQLVSQQLLNYSNLPIVNGKPDCHDPANGVNLHDVPCIAGKIGAGTGTTDTYEYDPNGNMRFKKTGSVTQRSITWNSFNKPQEITQGDTALTFYYGPSRNRYKQKIVSGTNTTTIHYVGGLFEEITDNNSGNKQFKHYITAGGQLIGVRTYYSNQVEKTHYIHRDHMGSTDAITDSAGAIAERSAFAPFGARKTGYWAAGPVAQIKLEYTTNVTMRQFTGHEDLNGVGLIHMNGRVYDPELGRFLSADPNVQFSHDPQSFNRYSYVLNNPLSFTDPSGYFLKSLSKAVFKFMRKYGRTVMAIGIALIVPNPFIGGFLSGMVSSGGDLQTAVISAITAQAFDFAGANITDKVGKIAAHGFIGGVSARAMGGDFKAGFLAAGFTAGVSSSSLGKSVFTNSSALTGKLQNAFAAAIIGGTASVIGGGKFANGAVTGAFSRMFGEAAASPGGESKNNATTARVIADESFGTADEAAFAAFNRYEEEYFSLSVDKELSGVIIQADGKYYYTSPVVRSKVDTFTLDIVDSPPGSEISAIYHTHPPIAGSRGFSNYDQIGVKNAGIPMYLRNPSGEFRALESGAGRMGRNACSSGYQCFSRHPAYKGL